MNRKTFGSKIKHSTTEIVSLDSVVVIVRIFAREVAKNNIAAIFVSLKTIKTNSKIKMCMPEAQTLR